MVNVTAPNVPAEGVPFGRYLIRKRIAKGGMGEVLLADQVGPLGPVRPVALKRMLPKLARDPTVARMFLDEMATAAQLNHPNIATTYDFGEVDGMYFLAMEYVEGLSLQDLIRNLGSLPVGAALSIVASIAEALSYAHTRKTPQGDLAPVVHRDVSPHNIMISSSGAVKLLDFGIARAEAAVLGGRLEGKLSYAAPEQLQGEPPERRSDLWALGVVLYEALTGVRPFDRDNPVEMLSAAIAGDYVPVEQLRPEAAGASRVIVRALLNDPTRRWPTAEGFRAACLEAAEQYEPANAAALGALVQQAGGPTKSVLGVEAFTSLNLGAGGPPGATQDLAILDRSGADGGTGTASISTAAYTVSTGGPWNTEALSGPHQRRKMIAAGVAVLGVIAFVLFQAPRAGVATHDGATPSPGTASREKASGPKPPASELATRDPSRIDRPSIDTIPAKSAVVATVAASPADPAPALDPEARKRRAQRPRSDKTSRDHAAKSARDAALLSTHGEPRTSAETRGGLAARSNDPRGDEHADSKGAAGVGLLSVRAVPWARVTMDGRFIGNSPLANLPVPEGTHELAFTANSGEFSPKSVWIRVRAGAATRVVLDFSSDKLAVEPPPGR